MARTPTTRWQIGAHRFAVRRLDHALVLGDTSMRHDPMRSSSRATIVGVVLTVLILAGCAALAFIRPAVKIGDASIVMDKNSGSLYVAENEVLHPAFNLASARLFVGNADDPVAVDADEIGGRARGAAIGIAGAPQSLPVTSDALAWSVCESRSDSGVGGITTVSVARAGAAPNADRPSFGADDAVLWRRDGLDYLVYSGVRARVDMANTAVTRALGLDDAIPNPVGRGLFDAVPEVPEIVPPIIDGAGEPTTYPLAGRVVGSVVSVDLGDRSRHYVVLRDGIQAIGSASAQLLRFADSAGRVGVDAVPPDVIARAPVTAAPLALRTFPERPPQLRADDSATCVEWMPPRDEAGDRAAVTLSSGATPSGPAVSLSSADGVGDGLDVFSMDPGTGIHVIPTGMAADDARRDFPYYVADTGVRFGVPSADDAAALGIGEPVLAPWNIVQLLPPGPALTRADARTTHDGS
ncbi:MAG: type VII secretion protein EccB [Rhodococcus sp. (in: high G+C Gram-positive bacteria)]